MDSYPGRLGQVLTNLLNNALMHGFEGHEHGLIEIVAEMLADGRVCPTVADDRIGIPPAQAERVFDRSTSTLCAAAPASVCTSSGVP